MSDEEDDIILSELDDEELRRKQMLEQLNELVIREPGEAAVLVKQWVRQVS